jgi:hypothetical protein
LRSEVTKISLEARGGLLAAKTVAASDMQMEILMHSYVSTLKIRRLMPAMLLLATAAAAQDTGGQSPAAQGGAAVPPAATSAAASSSPMWHNMQTMQEQMAKIHATKDPKTRAKLLDEHMKTMQETMQLMGNSGCPYGGMMNGGGMMGGRGMMSGAGPGQGGPGPRGNMMQLMLDQMQQHQQVMQGTAKNLSH